MSKTGNSRRFEDNEASAKLRMLKTSCQKLNLLARLIRNKPVDKALNVDATVMINETPIIINFIAFFIN